MFSVPLTELVLTHLRVETWTAVLCCQTTEILGNMPRLEKQVPVKRKSLTRG